MKDVFQYLNYTKDMITAEKIRMSGKGTMKVV